MFWLMSVHLSVHTGGGGIPARGVPWPGPGGGYPWWYPTLATPTPHQTWPGGTLMWGGVPHFGYPPHRTWLGGYPDGVCLLRSRRRTFLLSLNLLNSVKTFKKNSIVSLLLAWHSLKQFNQLTSQLPGNRNQPILDLIFVIVVLWTAAQIYEWEETNLTVCAREIEKR